MEFEDFEITFREVLVCIAITLVFLGLGFFISSKVADKENEKNEKYFKALKIENDSNMFEYALKTNVGYVLANGNVQAVNGISIEDIAGEYFQLRRVKEKYTKHTRQVAHTKIVGNTTQTYYTTEVYWTWDYAGEEEWHVENFRFLNKEFNYGTIKFNNMQYKETKKIDSHTRYEYYIIPAEFAGTLFTHIENSSILQNEFYTNTSINELIIKKENDLKNTKTAFWLLWIIFITLINFGYVYLDNDYLEDKKKEE